LRACPVPSCGSCKAKATSSRPPKRARTSSARCPTTTTRGDEEKPDVASSTCSSMGRPASGCSTFGNTECMRFPMPAARITMFMKCSENSLAIAPIGGRGIRSCVGRAFYQRAPAYPSGLSAGSSLVTKGPRKRRDPAPNGSVPGPFLGKGGQTQALPETPARSQPPSLFTGFVRIQSSSTISSSPLTESFPVKCTTATYSSPCWAMPTS